MWTKERVGMVSGDGVGLAAPDVLDNGGPVYHRPGPRWLADLRIVTRLGYGSERVQLFK